MELHNFFLSLNILFFIMFDFLLLLLFGMKNEIQIIEVNARNIS